MRRDPRGNPVTTDSAAALDASERALWRMMSFYGTPIDDLDAAIAADPAWRLPRLMKAGFLLSLTEPALAGEAAALLREAAAAPGPGDDRERAHLGALQRLADGDWLGASDAWSELLAAHPRDAIALQWAHLFDFYRGDSTQLRERAGAAAGAWPRPTARAFAQSARQVPRKNRVDSRQSVQIRRRIRPGLRQGGGKPTIGAFKSFGVPGSRLEREP